MVGVKENTSYIYIEIGNSMSFSSETDSDSDASFHMSKNEERRKAYEDYRLKEHWRRKSTIHIKYVCPSKSCHFATSNGKKEEILVHLYRKHKINFMRHLVRPCCLVNGPDEYLQNVEKELYFAIPLASKVDYAVPIAKDSNGNEIVQKADEAYAEKLEKFRFEKLLKDKRQLLGMISSQ